MAVRSKGFRTGTRQLLRKKPRQRGMAPVTHYLREFDEGESVSIVIDSSSHGGMPHRRFQGLTGTVLGRQGRAVRVRVRVGHAVKTVVVGPQHLRRVGARE